jgi:AI-2 transport protein TqsA
MLIEAPTWRAKLGSAFGSSRKQAWLDSIGAIAQRFRLYLVLRTVIGLVTGALYGAWLWVLGVDFALLWGAWSILLTYVPTVGYPLAVIPPTLLALIDRGVPTAMIVVVTFSVLNTFVYNVLQPKWAGESMNVSPLVVLISLFFWSIVLGAMGALLAVPLTMMVITLLESSEQTRWLANLARDRPPDAERSSGAAGS